MLDLETASRSCPIASESLIDALHDSCQVLIIGRGPAGSTCAALLAERGIDLILLEKGQHPRFHIGESLLPANLPLFEQLGVADAIAAIGMKKDGVDFNSPSHPLPTHVEFAEARDKSMSSAWQVTRSEFDEILLRNAQARSAWVVKRCYVRDGTTSVGAIPLTPTTSPNALSTHGCLQTAMPPQITPIKAVSRTAINICCSAMRTRSLTGFFRLVCFSRCKTPSRRWT